MNNVSYFYVNILGISMYVYCNLHTLQGIIIYFEGLCFNRHCCYSAKSPPQGAKADNRTRDISCSRQEATYHQLKLDDNGKKKRECVRGRAV